MRKFFSQTPNRLPELWHRSLFYLETHQQNLAHTGNTASSITIYQTKPNNHINVHQTQHIPIQHIKIHKYTNDM